MKLEIDIPSILYQDAKENGNYISVTKLEIAWKAIADGKPLEQEPFINKSCVSSGVCEHDKNKVLDKIRAEIMELDNKVCQQFLIEDVDKEVHRTYRECIDIIDKYKAESEEV